jgi:thiamine biosynthesis lipoprotein
MRTTRSSVVWLAFLLCVAGLIVVGVLMRGRMLELHVKTSRPAEPSAWLKGRRGKGIMGTDYNFKVLFPVGRADHADRVLGDALAAARDVERLMSTHLEASQLSRLNAAPGGQRICVDPALMEVLLAAERLHEETEGAFDVTIHPIVRLWREARQTGRVPSDAELIEARAVSRWEHFELGEEGVRKRVSTAAIGLGGIAKGYAIDRAVETMLAAGAHGGLVEIGGDVRCFGDRPGGGPWLVAVRNPFHVQERKKPLLATLGIRDAAVCTSGNYERAAEIGGRRYSHIFDPADPLRNLAGQFPASVTVVAMDAMTADAWATALSVLGPERGLELLQRPENERIEAMFVVGRRDDYATPCTEGFRRLYVDGKGPARTACRASQPRGELKGARIAF